MPSQQKPSSSQTLRHHPYASPAGSQHARNSGPYRLETGVNKGKTLDECGLGFIKGLMARVRAANMNGGDDLPAELKEALDDYLSKPRAPANPSTPIPASIRPSSQPNTINSFGSIPTLETGSSQSSMSSYSSPMSAMRLSSSQPTAPSPLVTRALMPSSRSVLNARLGSSSFCSSSQASSEPNAEWQPPKISEASSFLQARFKENGMNIILTAHMAFKTFGNNLSACLDLFILKSSPILV